MRTPLVIIALVALTAALVSPAHAQSGADVAAARELFKEAAQLGKEGRWEEAKERLKRSLALKPAPITHYSLGVAQRKTRDFVEALESFRAFLVAGEEPATKQYRELAQQAVREIEPRVARVVITVQPADVRDLSIAIDGRNVPSAALERPRLVNPGEHRIEAGAPGYVQASDRFAVEEGGSTEVKLTLIPAPAAPKAPTAKAEPSSQPAEESPVSVVPGVVLVVAGAAALGAGIAVGLVGLSEASDAPTNDGEAADAARTKGIVGDTLAAVGGAAAGVGVILLIVHAVGSDESPAKEGAVRPWLAGNVAGIELRFQ